jgi:hypothetical protein
VSRKFLYEWKDRFAIFVVEIINHTKQCCCSLKWNVFLLMFYLSYIPPAYSSYVQFRCNVLCVYMPIFRGNSHLIFIWLWNIWSSGFLFLKILRRRFALVSRVCHPCDDIIFWLIFLSKRTTSTNNEPDGISVNLEFVVCWSLLFDGQNWASRTSDN